MFLQPQRTIIVCKIVQSENFWPYNTHTHKIKMNNTVFLLRQNNLFIQKRSVNERKMEENSRFIRLIASPGRFEMSWMNPDTEF